MTAAMGGGGDKLPKVVEQMDDEAKLQSHATWNTLRESVHEAHKTLGNNIQRFDDENLVNMSIETLGEILASLTEASKKMSDFIEQKKAVASDSPNTRHATTLKYQNPTVEDMDGIKVGSVRGDQLPEGFTGSRSATTRDGPTAGTTYETKPITGKRRHDGNGDIAPWPKKSKDKHMIPHFGAEAEFLDPPVEFDIEAEVNRRLEEIEALRALPEGYNSKTLSHKEKKRRELSDDLADNGLPMPRPKLEPRKRVKMTGTEEE